MWHNLFLRGSNEADDIEKGCACWELTCEVLYISVSMGRIRRFEENIPRNDEFSAVTPGVGYLNLEICRFKNVLFGRRFPFYRVCIETKPGSKDEKLTTMNAGDNRSDEITNCRYCQLGDAFGLY